VASRWLLRRPAGWSRGHLLALVAIIGLLPLLALAQQLATGHVDQAPIAITGLTLALLLTISVNNRVARASRRDRLHATLLAKASGAFALADPDGTITYVSPTSEGVLGSSPREVVGRSVMDFVGLVDPTDLAGPGAALMSVFATPGAAATERLRILDVTGTERWLEVGASNRLADPDIRGIVVSYHDVTAEVIAQIELKAGHGLLTATEELAHVGSWEQDTRQPAPRWSMETWRILGLDPAATTIDEHSFERSVHPDDVEIVRRAGRNAFATGEPLDDEFRIIRPDGEIRHLRGIGRVERDDAGRPVRIFGANLDVTEARLATDLLRVQADILANLHEAVIVTDLKGRITHWGGAASKIFGYGSDEMSGRTLESIYPALPKNTAKQRAKILTGSGYSGEWTGLRKDGSTVWLSVYITGMRDASGSPTGFLGVAADISAGHVSARQLARMSAAIEQTSESIVITNTKAEIEYVNPAFERVSGYSRSEVIGKNPRMLQSGEQDASFYRAMWDALTAGQPWAADFTNRHKDGTLYLEEAVISAIYDISGSITGYIAVKRDVTELRRLEVRADQQLRERTLISETITALSGRFTPEESAEAICRQVVRMTDVNTAGLFIFELDDRAVPYGFAVIAGAKPALRRLSRERTAYLRAQAHRGPWIEHWVDTPGHPFNPTLTKLGVRTIAYAPIRDDERVIGFLEISSSSADANELLGLALPALVEFAEIAGTLLSVEIASRTEVEAVRRAIQEVISDEAFSPVFQPIVDVMRDEVVGYEALTRFHDSIAPDIRFMLAAKVGLGVELELATLQATITPSSLLPAGAFLNVNVSPELVLAGTGLAALVALANRELVLEVTEHAAIADYAAFRAAVAALGPRVSLAVDDAGAGYASLQHILELRPAVVKLDRSLIAGIDTDPARRALVTGMHQFVHATGSRLIAEGVETAGELAALRELDVHLAQGYLLGRPAAMASAGRPKGRVARPAPKKARKKARKTPVPVA